ncbi:hypothetical protein ATR52_22750 [Salmonella enterica subsp. enterica serovar Rubislaw]|uniref:Uncharacterized protein n=1 Tax=Salmonella enterica TaxID=28901 RepID=A0A5U3KW06_SALER|nr:hypothetical protein [Salmonella enterica]ECX6383896.1 hypothetical protein [Salmonella enterica subsp. enterica serovar Rubislaw]EBP0805271.1 hypothetical protein [Salmonella enterica]EEC2013598.1 hypothetical protein [Salmonella enterica subsp. enterica serovar Rubislaw]EEE7102673.1 hypothetical protein [Salmonella enterica subsp. enterica serovar Rubislaw]
MINPNKTLSQKALAGASFLRMHAEGMSEDDDFFIALMSEPHVIAANAIEQLVKENAELRAQLVAFQKAANPAVAVDLASGPDTTACYTPFVKGARVCLKVHPYQRGTIANTRFDDRRGYLISVRFDSEFENNRWVKANHLELIPEE